MKLNEGWRFQEASGKASEADLAQVAALVNSAYRGESSRAGWTTEADYLDGQRTDARMLEEELRDPSRKLLCLWGERARELLGCCMLKRFEDARGAACVLGMLTVRPIQQGSGIGKLLMEKAEEVARAWGANRMAIDVIHLRTELIAWYKRHGYVETGETRPFPYGQARLGLPRRQDLHFVLFEKPL